MGFVSLEMLCIIALQFAGRPQFFRLYRSTMYVDAACCYRWNSMVSLSVCNDHEPCKNRWTDRDAVYFGLRTQVGVLDGGPDSPGERAILRGNGAAHCKV